MGSIEMSVSAASWKYHVVATVLGATVRRATMSRRWAPACGSAVGVLSQGRHVRQSARVPRVKGRRSRLQQKTGGAVDARSRPGSQEEAGFSLDNGLCAPPSPIYNL
jgi:hypothetical protein